MEENQRKSKREFNFVSDQCSYCSSSTVSVCPCAAVATGVDEEFVAAAAAVGGVAMASL